MCCPLVMYPMPPPSNHQGDPHDKPITVASDCSGLDLAPLLLRNLGYACRSLWVSDVSEAALSFIRLNADPYPEEIFRDIAHREEEALPKHPDLYLAGPPCTAWSSLNSKQEWDDPRIQVFERILDTIDAVQPRVFVIENTRGLYHFHKGQTWTNVSYYLDNMNNYFWEHQVLCPSIHADCPQSRPRIFIVGLHKSLGARRVPWPPETKLTKTCMELIDTHVSEGRRVAPVYWKFMDRWGIPANTMGIVEPNAASRSHNCYKDLKPLTLKQKESVARTDIAACVCAKDPGPFIPGLGRHCTAAEIARLQGYDDTQFTFPRGMTELQCVTLLGNAFNGAVLSELLRRLVPLLQKPSPTPQ